MLGIRKLVWYCTVDSFIACVLRFNYIEHAACVCIVYVPHMLEVFISQEMPFVEA